MLQPLWPSGLRQCKQKWKDTGSNPARRSAWLRDSTSLRVSITVNKLFHLPNQVFFFQGMHL